MAQPDNNHRPDPVPRIDAFRAYPTLKGITLAAQGRFAKLADWKWSETWKTVEKLKSQINFLTGAKNRCSGAYITTGYYAFQPHVVISISKVEQYFSRRGEHRARKSEESRVNGFILGTTPESNYDTYWPAEKIIFHRNVLYDFGNSFIFFKNDLEAQITRAQYYYDLANADLQKEIALFNKLAGANANAYYLGTTGEKLTGKDSSTGGNGNGNGNGGTFISKADLDAQDVIYNVGSVREAYLPARVKPQYDTEELDVDGTPGNTWMNSPSTVKDAKQLWNTALGSKGMLQTYFPAGGQGTDVGGQTGNFSKNVLQKKYGFQFLYNPGSINMNYMGVAQTDVALQMSGKDKINYIPPANTSASVTFSILLNRMFDMKYYNNDGSLKPEALASNIYSPRNPFNAEEGKAYGIDFDEQNAIYNKGTMYDVEYLLRVLLGFTMKSQLRQEMTADMGFFSRRQVELHLGPTLRYRGFVNTLSVNHVMFNERMVPTLSYVQIGFSRYPDYPFTDSTTGSSTTSGGTGGGRAQVAL